MFELNVYLYNNLIDDTLKDLTVVHNDKAAGL